MRLLLALTKVMMVLVMSVMAPATVKLAMEPLRRRLWGMWHGMTSKTTTTPKCEGEECLECSEQLEFCKLKLCV
jgi:hypothetical protein